MAGCAGGSYGGATPVEGGVFFFFFLPDESCLLPFLWFGEGF